MNAIATGGLQVVGCGAGARGSWPGQEQPQRTACHLGDGGRAHVQREAEMGGVEVGGRLNVVDEVADAGVLVGCCHRGSPSLTWVGRFDGRYEPRAPRTGGATT